MNNQTFVLALLIICSLSGWYVVITKYLALKHMIENPEEEYLQHIPGMGPPPVNNIPYMVPEDLMSPPGYASHADYLPPGYAPPPGYIPPGIDPHGIPYSPPPPMPQAATNPGGIPQTTPAQKRQVCNYACMIHLGGFAMLFGIPFLNVIVPAMLWLWKKEEHPFLAKHGREVINFQITYALIQFLSLGAGVLFIRYMPAAAEKLFAFFKITRIVFSSALNLPFNIFTALPFFWCCIVMIRGAVAAYNGINYKYPATQPFIFANGEAPDAKAKQPASPATR